MCQNTEFQAYIGRRSILCGTHSVRQRQKQKTILGTQEQRYNSGLSGFHLLLLAKNKKGYQNLCKLVSISWVDGFYQKPRIDKNVLKTYSEGLIVSSARLGGEIPQYILNNEIDKAEETINWFRSVFGDDFYLEVQLHKPTRPEISNETYLNQQRVNEEIYRLARKTGTKVVATNDIHFVEEIGRAHV